LYSTSFTSQNFTQSLAKAILRLKSWKLDITLPPVSKYVLIGAPHTSNWDLFYALLLLHAAHIQPRFIAKHTLFRQPLGTLMRWLGGIPVNRLARHNFVQQVVEAFNRVEELVIAIAPEGTRSLSQYWKSGFYYIAQGAGVPIALGYIDYPRKMVGIGPTIWPTGDIQADFRLIRAFYTGKQGKHRHLQGGITLQQE
jgi:1-acyl-sn-glycerol-3-phosphate acyltransferase